MLVAAALVALWTADVALFAFNAPPPRNVDGLYVADATRGYALKPGFSGRVTAGYDFEVKINSRGYRDPEWTFDKDFRVLVVGNSFVFGLPLPIEEGFVAKARAVFNGAVGFFGAGVPSYGVPHGLATVRRECPVVKPRHVFYVSDYNDYRLDHMETDSRSVVDGRLFTNWADDRVTRLKTPLSQAEIERQMARTRKGGGHPFSLVGTLTLRNVRIFLSQHHLHPTQIVERLLIAAGLGSEAFDRYAADRYLKTRPKAYSDPAMIAKAAAWIADMKDAARTCGARFTFLVLPNAAEGFYGLKEPSTEGLLTLLKKRDVDVLDLRRHVRRGTVLSLPRSGYYNAESTSWVADYIVRHLRRLYPTLPRETVG